MQTRIKAFGYEIFGLKDIACHYHFNASAIAAIDEITLAKSILHFVKETMQQLVATHSAKEVQVSFSKLSLHVQVIVNESSRLFSVDEQIGSSA